DVVGEHEGYPFYTVGQRKGLGLSTEKPVYVINIDPANNRIEVGDAEDLEHRGLRADTVNLISVEDIPEPIRVTARIRYKDPGAPATCRVDREGRLELIFDEPRRAITRGQS